MTFSDAQATAFINTWQVIDHIPDTASDFSATIFRNIQTGAYSLAIRGSTSLTDFAADAALIVLDGTAVRQVVDLYNFWQRSTTRGGLTYVAAKVVPYFSPLTPTNAIRVGDSAYGIVFTNSSELSDITLRQATGVIPAGLGTLNVAGHSLGGHLAMAFTRLFPALASDALGINGLGFKIGNTTVDSLFSILGGVGADAFTYSKIQNVYGIAGLEFAAMNNAVLQQPGKFDGVYIESASPLLPIVGGHGAGQMTDSLALYSLYAKLSPNLTLAQITTLLKSASPTAERTLESALDALRIVLQGKTLAEANPTKYEGTDARDSLYRNIKALQDSAAYSALSGSTALRLSAQEGADSLAQKAKNDFGWFLAVQELLPIAIEGGGSALIGANPDLYGRWSADRVKRIDGSSDLEFTDAYIADRSTMLAWWMVGNAEDRGYGPTTGGENWQFLDVASGKAAYALSTGAAIDQANAAAGDAKRLVAMFEAEMKLDRGHRVGFGGDGADQITGDALDDRLYGMAGNDVLQGMGGNDHIEGGRDDDFLIGGKGNDVLNGGQGYDSYTWNTGDGNDTLIDSDKKGRFLINGQGIKALLKQSATTWTSPDTKVTLTQTDGRWKLSMEGGSLDLGTSFTDGDYGIRRLETPTLIPRTKGGDLEPILNGGQLQYDDLGNVIVDSATAHNGRADTLYGSTGNDRVQGLGGDDVLIGQSGNDILEGGTGSDVVKGGAGNDLVLGAGQITVAAAYAAGNSDSSSTAQGDWYDGGSDDDVLLGGAAKDALSGGDGSDLLIGGAGDDLLMGDASLTSTRTDWTVGRETVDNETEIRFTARYTNADVQNSPVSGDDDALYGGKGEDWAFGGGGDDVIDGGDDNDVLMGDAGNDILLGGLGDDTLDGDSPDVPLAFQGDDWLDGGAGKDNLFGDAGDDVLIGGKGNDYIVGGKGRDTYIFNKGDGIDEIYDDDTGADKSILIFGEGVDKDAIVLRKGSLLLDLGDGDAIHIENFDAANPLATQSFEAFQFADGSSLSWNELLARGFDLDGTEGDDTIVGTGLEDRIDGKAGNDLIWGLAGNDTLTGGLGTDGLYGGLGNDTYILNKGDGATTNGNWTGVAETLVDEGGEDAVRFAADVGVQYFTLTAATNGDLVINYSATGQPLDRLLIDNGQGGVIERFEVGAGGTARTLGYSQFVGEYGAGLYSGMDGQNHLHVAGGKTADSLYTGGGNAVVSGGRGNDDLQAYGANNTILYSVGDGSDRVRTDGPGNVLKLSGVTADELKLSLGSARELMLQVGSNTSDIMRFDRFDAASVLARKPFDHIEFDPSTGSGQAGVTLSYEDLLARGFDLAGTTGDDTIAGTSANDRINGGAGNDTLSGGAGDDRYSFAAGDGQDQVIDTAGTDTVAFGPGLNAADLSVTQHVDAGRRWLDLAFAGGERVSIRDGYQGAVERFEFADGGVLTATEVLDRLSVQVATDGNDNLFCGVGDDTLDGGLGNDTLDGGAGNDIYLFGRGDGQDTVMSWDENRTKQDVVQFKEGIAPSDVRVIRLDDDHLVLKIPGTPDQLTVWGYFANDGVFNPNGIEFIRFSDGTRWDYATVRAKSMLGTDGNDSLVGFDFNDVIDGLDGNDTIDGRGGNDILQGGAGNDTLRGWYGDDTLDGGAGNDSVEGGSGNNTFLFGRGDGQDTLVGWNWSGQWDSIQFKEGITAADILVRRNVVSQPLNGWNRQ